MHPFAPLRRRAGQAARRAGRPAGTEAAPAGHPRPPEDGPIPEPSDSYFRCLRHPGFFARFYERFLASDPVVARYFVGTDWPQQHAFLRNGLAMLLLHVHGSPTAIHSLQRIGASHGASGLAVQDHLYDRWREALVATIRECDPHWTSAVEEAWHRVLHDGIAVIRRAAGLT